MAFNPLNRKLDKNGNPIVSKKELEESGLSLRDFLNRERGLTRRGSAGKVSDADIAGANDTEDPIRTLNKDKGWTKDDTFVRRSAKSGDDAKSSNYVRRDMQQRRAEIEKETIGDEMAMKYKPRRPDVTDLSMTRKPGTNTNYENKNADTSAYKKGGKVSSASSRADGIAQRGKTRGKLV